MEEEMDVEQIFSALNAGDRKALDDLVPVVYNELRRLAHIRLRSERPDHTLNTTALVHEVYLRLAGVNQLEWQNRAHVMAMASRSMRRVLVDYAERRNAAKRGAGQETTDLDEDSLLLPDPYTDAVSDLNEALERLEILSWRQSQVVEYRYFGGLTLEETAEVLGVSLATVKRDLRFAQAWLSRELSSTETLDRLRGPIQNQST